MEDRDPDKADSLFHLGEHYRSLSSLTRFKISNLEEEIGTVASKEAKARLGQSLQAERVLEERWIIEAIKTDLRIVQGKQWASFKRMDELLFTLVDLLRQANRQQKAREFFARLIKKYPRSPYVPYAYVSLGDFMLANRKITTALKSYEKVNVKYRTLPIYKYALYKQGWCWLRLKDPRRSLSCFVKAIQSSPADSSIQQELWRSVVIAFSEAGAPDSAGVFFKRIGGDTVEMIKQLAAIYRASGRTEDAAVIEGRRRLRDNEPMPTDDL